MMKPSGGKEQAGDPWGAGENRGIDRKERGHIQRYNTWDYIYLK